MKICLIDYSSEITEMIQKYLTLEKINCVTSNSGARGFDLITKQSFDFVLLDLAMPDFSGIDLIHKLEKEGLLQEQHIIIFTASSASNEQISSLLKKEGVHAFLRKPLKLLELKSLITEKENSQLA